MVMRPTGMFLLQCCNTLEVRITQNSHVQLLAATAKSTFAPSKKLLKKNIL